MSIADLALHYGTDTTYGTAATLTRSFETQVDDWKRTQEYLQSQGFVGGQHTIRSRRSTPVNMGGGGSIQIDVLNKGMGLWLRDMFGTSTGPTQQGATTAYVQTHATAAAGPTRSATIQAVRSFVDGGSQAFTHVGCVCKGWELNCETGSAGFLNLKAEYDAQSVVTNISAGSNNYTANADPFNWQQALITVGGSAVDFRKVNLKADYKMNTDRRFMRANALKKKPRLGDIPEITGELEGEFESLTQYNSFVAGTLLVAQFKWTGALIEGAHFFEVTVDMPAIQYTGESPEASLTDSPKLVLPFVVLHDEAVGAAVTLTVKSTDIAF
jgi:hypothetical protein